MNKRRIWLASARVLAPRTFVAAPRNMPLPFEIERLPPGRMASFGSLHPDKIFYVIWRRSHGSGLFSNASVVLCHLMLADAGGMEPVVDFLNFPTVYNEDVEVAGTRNAWEYYFGQTTPAPLDEVYESRHVFVCDGTYPIGFSLNVSEIAGAQETFDRDVTVRPEIEDEVRRWALGFGEKTLGVHFRGQEMNRAASHPFGPTERQILDVTGRLLRDRGFDRVFLVTEDQGHLDLFRREFGNLVMATDSFRTRRANAYRMNPRPLHRYLLGREVLRDAMLLGRCQGLVSCGSNVTEFARLFNAGRYEADWHIDNGFNSSNPYVALYLHGLRKRLPRGVGGLTGRIVTRGGGAAPGGLDS